MFFSSPKREGIWQIYTGISCRRFFIFCPYMSKFILHNYVCLFYVHLIWLDTTENVTDLVCFSHMAHNRERLWSKGFYFRLEISVFPHKEEKHFQTCMMTTEGVEVMGARQLSYYIYISIFLLWLRRKWYRNMCLFGRILWPPFFICDFSLFFPSRHPAPPRAWDGRGCVFLCENDFPFTFKITHIYHSWNRTIVYLPFLFRNLEQLFCIRATGAVSLDNKTVNERVELLATFVAEQRLIRDHPNAARITRSGPGGCIWAVRRKQAPNSPRDFCCVYTSPLRIAEIFSIWFLQLQVFYKWRSRKSNLLRLIEQEANDTIKAARFQW